MSCSYFFEPCPVIQVDITRMLLWHNISKVHQITSFSCAFIYADQLRQDVYLVGWDLFLNFIIYVDCVFWWLYIHLLTSSLHFCTETRFRFQFAFGPRELKRFSSTQHTSLLVTFPFLFVFCPAALLFLFPLMFFGLQITSVSPFRIGACERLDLLYSWFVFCPTPCVLCTSSRPSPVVLFCFALQFLLSSQRRLLFRAPVPGLIKWLCFVSRRGFLVIPLAFPLFHTEIQASCQRLSFVPLIDFTPTFFCSRDIFLRAYILSLAPFRFIMPLTFFCLNHLLAFVVWPSANNTMHMKPHVFPLSC